MRFGDGCQQAYYGFNAYFTGLGSTKEDSFYYDNFKRLFSCSKSLPMKWPIGSMPMFLRVCSGVVSVYSFSGLRCIYFSIALLEKVFPSGNKGFILHIQ